MEVGEVQSSEDQGHESKTRGEGRRVALEEGVVDLRHGTLSLAILSVSWNGGVGDAGPARTDACNSVNLRSCAVDKMNG
jgi:hypothetical protein